MPINRFFYEGSLEEGNRIDFPHEEAKHITRVLRLSVGDEIEITNGRGVLACAEISHVSKNNASATITSVEKYPSPFSTLHLWQACIRASKLDLIVEKGTELGVTHFHFYMADISEKEGLSANQKKRLEIIAMSACKQSGRLFLPSLNFDATLDQLESGFFGDISQEAPSALSLPRDNTIHFVNGPEGGFSEKEYLFFQKKGLKGISLSDAVLRTETAAIAAAALLGGRRPNT